MRIKELKEKLCGSGEGSSIAFADLIRDAKGNRPSNQVVRNLLSNNNALLELKDGGYVILTGKTKVIRVDK